MVRIRSFPDVNRALKRIQSAFQSLKTAQALGEQGRDIIYQRTKRGFGVTSDRSNNPSKRRLKALSPGYIQQRRRRGVRGAFGSTNFSNLTNTGQTLDSIQIKTKRGEFTLLIPNTRRDDGKTNREVAQHVRKDRPFFAFTRAEQRILELTAQRIINRIVKLSIG